MPDHEIHIFAPLSAIRKWPRLAKMVPVFLDMGLDVKLHGWERKAGERQAFAWPDKRVHERAILRGGGYVTRLARAMYPIWMVMVFLRVLTLGRRKLLFCLGWESAFPALLASRLTGSRVIFDDADRFSMLLKLPGPAHRLLVRLEKWASTQSVAHLIPGWTRYDFSHAGMKLLRNTPTSGDFDRARRIAQQRPEADLVLYVNGWIGETRGASVFLSLMRRLQSSQPAIVMVAAGWTDCTAGHALFALPNVRFEGELSTEAALALYIAHGISAPVRVVLTQQTLIASVLFFFAMTLASLFKLTGIPWAECAAYLRGLTGIGLGVAVWASALVPVMLICGALGMLLLVNVIRAQLLFPIRSRVTK